MHKLLILLHRMLNIKFIDRKRPRNLFESMSLWILLKDSLYSNIKFNGSWRQGSNSKSKLHCIVLLLKLFQRMFWMCISNLLHKMYRWLCFSKRKVHFLMSFEILRIKWFRWRKIMSLLPIELQEMLIPNVLPLVSITHNLDWKLML